MRKETEKFLEFLLKMDIKPACFVWRAAEMKERQIQVDKTIYYLNELADIDLKKILSDPYWIRYPTFSKRSGPKYDQNPDSLTIDDKFFGPFLNQLISCIFEVFPNLFSKFIKYSDGIFLLHSMSWTSGKSRINAAKRGYKSKDERVRIKSVNYIPASLLKKMFADKSSSVRKNVVSRLGVDHCAKYFINDKSPRLQYLARRSVSYKQYDYVTILESFGQKLKNKEKIGYKNYYEVKLISHILRSLPKKELVYYLHLSSYYQNIDKLLQNRLELEKD